MRSFFIISIVLLVISLTCYAIQSDDLFMYLAVAKEYFKSGALPQYDLFLYTLSEYRWTIMHQWLGYFIFYGLYVLGGFNLIIILKTFFITFFLSLPVLNRKITSVSLFIWGISVFIAMYAMSFRLMERTSLFSDFFIVGLLFLLFHENQNPGRWKYLLPFIFLFWVNIHPVFPIGWALCLLFLLVNFKKFRNPDYIQFAGLSLTSILLCLVNPKGLDGFLYPLQFARNEGVVFRKYYFEWMPTLDPMFLYQPQTLFLMLLILLNLFLLYKLRRTRPYFEAAASFFFIIYGLYAIRFVPTLCFALVLINSFLSLSLTDFKFSKKLNYAVAAVALIFAIKNMTLGYQLISGPRTFGLGLDPALVPAKSAQILLDSPQVGNVFNSHLFGSYLSWHWEGKRKIFYHGFVTGTNLFLNEYAAFSGGIETFSQQVDKYQIQAFLLDRFRGNEALLNNLVNHPQWQLAYKDEGSLIFTKRIP